MFFSGPYEGKSVAIPQGKTITLGRNRDLELSLPDGKLSRRHCQISCRDDQYILKDLHSTNGTFVNGDLLKGEVVLSDFDRIVVGDIEMEFHHTEQVPLPLSFDPASADPFGLAEDDDEVELESLQQLDSAQREAPATRGAFETEKRPATPVGLRLPSKPAAAPAPASTPPPAGPSTRLGVPKIHALVERPSPAASEKKSPSGIQRVAVALAPDLLEAALRDLDLPLPPEPPPLQVASQDAGAGPKLMFCTVCEGSIPTLDFELGVARLVDERLVCGECLAKGAKPAAQAAGPKAVAAERAEEKKRSVDEILKALDGEAVIIDTTPKRGSNLAPGAEEAGTKTAPREVPKELGEEFEEIG